MIRQSFCYPIYQGDPDLFAQAREIGYEATEFWGWNAEMPATIAAAKTAGLKIASFTAHDGIEKGFSDPREFDRIEAEVRLSIDRAVEVGCPGVICFPGGRDGIRNDTEALIDTARAVRRVASYAEEKGISLNFEILNSRVDHPGYLADTVEWGVALCEMVGSPRVKILFDIYHVQVMQGDLIARLRYAMPFIGHIHTAGVPGRHELDDHQEISYPAVMRELLALGYDGYVGHEFFPVRLEKVESLRQAFDVCAVDHRKVS